MASVRLKTASSTSTAAHSAAFSCRIVDFKLFSYTLTILSYSLTLFMKTSLFWRQHWLNSVLNSALTNVLHDFSAVFILCVVFKFDDKMRMTVCASCFAANWDKAKVKHCMFPWHRLHIFRQISLTFYFTARCFNSTFTCFSAAGSGTVQDGVIRGRSYHV